MSRNNAREQRNTCLPAGRENREQKLEDERRKRIRIISSFFFLFPLLFSIVYAQDKFTPLEKLNNEKSTSLTGFTYDDKGKRNPFVPLVTSTGRLLKSDVEGTKGDLVIEGIIYDEQGVSYAIINGSVVKAGDFIDNIQVFRVEKDKVVVIKEGKEFKLELINKNKEE